MAAELYDVPDEYQDSWRRIAFDSLYHTLRDAFAVATSDIDWFCQYEGKLVRQAMRANPQKVFDERRESVAGWVESRQFATFADTFEISEAATTVSKLLHGDAETIQSVQPLLEKLTQMRKAHMGENLNKGEKVCHEKEES